MHKSAIRLQNIVSLRVLEQKSLRSAGSKQSHAATGHPTSPIVFPEKRGHQVSTVRDDPFKTKAQEHCVDIDELSDLLGYDIFSGKLALVRRSKSTGTNEQSGSGYTNPSSTDAKLTSKALTWGSQTLLLEDVVSVSYNTGLRYFNVHAYPLRKRSGGLSCILKPKRCRKDFCFLASSSEEAIQWVSRFADLQIFVKCSPHPMNSSRKKSAKDLVASIPLFDEPYIKCKSPPRIFVILNPRSGHGRSSKVFYGKVQPIFELAGFEMNVVKTTAAGHARKLAATVDINTCPDGIVCVGGDGIINEVLNGLFNRDDRKEAISIPIGIIPAGSDNSLVWTILGIRDPIAAALSIVKGALTPTDVFAVEWIQTGAIHYGNTVSYFGFLSDVLELSEKYQKHFGPLRYFVAGFLKFLCLPKYSFELEYLPVTKEVQNDRKAFDEEGKLDMPDLYKDILRRSRKEGIPRASSLSSIESIMSPSRMSGDLDVTGSTLASSEPSEVVRGLDPKSKRLSSSKSNQVPEPEEVIHPHHHLSSTPNWPRTRSKPWMDKGWSSLNTKNDSRFSWAPTTSNDKEEISSAISDPGPVWDVEPNWDGELIWDNEANWDADDPIRLPVPPVDNADIGMVKEPVPELSEKWVVKKGQFLGILACNHSCKTVQSLSSQVIAPKAVHDDRSLDLLLVHGRGRLRLLRFFVYLQFGRHLSLPYVEYVKVKSVKLQATRKTSNGCGIDGELLPLNGQVLCSMLPDQCHLIGRPARARLQQQ
ncbi:sphingoid long-chain bases kinase 1-like isoform X2 [Phalaenopsis equestris]|nr:sphingoid long-chain bases kinase 1-like isoform X2 [Phalaenopsis equestris]XP_020597579.1 sphingoid long-chain bases kinase 1-like isoform X2 [Phalaenopsis equestris]XP_020597587.1 sphingoid long-chain bases kinase 1-like isoform X2 [Phalaenopsis equestris]XP_020597594.1 sphingoid long-chain bases kinase 1-like isoform X2 [Phalaenopsis equestris]XP_020597603.1 sphingoid long-chain bases kinase 1-like isoform X2 [Phalaenopsis equestris]XP_020597612.1 sphingoid long-chain bases kinase 1-like